MPQMAPCNWLMMFLMFNMIMMFLISFNNYMYLINIKKYMLKFKPMYIWKW